MQNLSLSLVILSVLIAVTLACKCREQSTKESFCNAHWVSHVKVKVRVGKQGLPEGSERKGLNNLRYTVQHVEVFKVSEFDLFYPAGAKNLLISLYQRSIQLKVTCISNLQKNVSMSKFF